METIITVATILNMFLSAGSNVNSEYFYNADIVDGQVNAMYVYDRSASGLSPKLEYRYAYDALERLTEKEAFAWNEVSKEWEPSYRLTYTYGEDSFEVERSNWDADSHAYKNVDEKAVYLYEFNNLVSVNYLKWSGQGNGFEVVDRMLVLNPRADLLLAYVK